MPRNIVTKQGSGNKMATLELILYCTVVFAVMVGLICGFTFGLIWSIKLLVRERKGNGR